MKLSVQPSPKRQAISLTSPKGQQFYLTSKSERIGFAREPAVFLMMTACFFSDQLYRPELSEDQK